MLEDVALCLVYVCHSLNRRPFLQLTLLKLFFYLIEPIKIKNINAKTILCCPHGRHVGWKLFSL